MNEDWDQKINEMNIRLVKLESASEHHSGRFLDVHSKHDALESKLVSLQEKVDSSTKEILEVLNLTARQVANLRGWVVGIGIGAAAIFTVMQFLSNTGILAG